MSLGEFSRATGGRRSLKSAFEGTSRESGDDLDAEPDSIMRVRVPDVDEQYWDNLSITLTAEEAAFLRAHITANVSDTLLGQMLLDEQAVSHTVYRLAFGQPRQAELVEHLLEHEFSDEEMKQILDNLMVNLSPISQEKQN